MTLDLAGRLLCASQQAYEATVTGDAPDSPASPAPPPSSLVGWRGAAHAFVAGEVKINAVLLGQTASEVIVAFRGTLPFNSPDSASVIADWATDLAVPLANDPDCPGSVHSGFLGDLDSLWDSLWPPLQQLAAANPAKALCITGHSKGGALANIAAVRCKKRGLSPYVCTFAAARPGDQAFATGYDGLVPHSTRYEYADDIVPHLPPEDGYLESLLRKAPFFDAAIGPLTIGYVSVGSLQYYAAPLGPPQPDSAALQGQRLASLADKLLTGQFGKIIEDHELSPGYGYATAICPGEWPLLTGQ